MDKGKKKKIYKKPSYQVAEIFEKLSLRCPNPNVAKEIAGVCHVNHIIS